MEAVGLQLLPGRRQESAGEVDASWDANKEEEGEEEEEKGEDSKNLDTLNDGQDSDHEVDNHLRQQVIRLLHELEEAREMALKHEDDALELQSLLEDERLASAHQAELFTQQIQRLQAQVHSLNDEFHLLHGGKAVTLERIEQELQEANKEIHSLQLNAEEAAALHENEIASLQEELCRLKAELQRVQSIRNEYDMELTALRAEIGMKQALGSKHRHSQLGRHSSQDKGEEAAGTTKEVAVLQEELENLQSHYVDLMEEYQTLQASNKVMLGQLEKLEALKYNKYRNKPDDTSSSETISQWPADRRYSLIRQLTTQKGSCVSFRSVEIVGVASDYNNEEKKEKMEKVEEEEEKSEQDDLKFQLQNLEEKVQRVETKGEPSQFEFPVEDEMQPSSQDLDVRKRKRRLRGSLKERQDSVQKQKSSKGLLGKEVSREVDVRAASESPGARKPRSEPESKTERGQAQKNLQEMAIRFQHSQAEWEQLQEELRLCKEEIERLNGSVPVGGRVPAGGLKPLALFVVLAGGLFLYPRLKRFSFGGPLT